MSEDNGLPRGWAWTKISDIADTRTGGTPSRRDPSLFNGGIPWIKSGELKDGVVHSSEEKITDRAISESSAKIFPSGTLCIALYGATVGKLGILGIDAATNQAICGIFLPEQVEPKYVFHYLGFIRPNLIEQAKGGAQPNISNSIIRLTKLPLAPADEQRRIVAKIEELFSDLDAGVAALQRAKAKLTRYRASVLKAAVEGRLTERWRAEHPNTEPASELLARILVERRRRWEEDQLARYAEKGKQPPKNWREKYKEPEGPDTKDLPALPEGWCWATLDQIIASLRNGLSPRPSVEPPGHRLLRINAVRPMSVDLDEVRFLDWPRQDVEPYFVETGDLLFTRYNGSVDLLGVAGMIRDCPQPTLHPDKLIRVKPVIPQLAAFLEVAVNVGASRSHMVGRARTTAGQTGISASTSVKCQFRYRQLKNKK